MIALVVVSDPFIQGVSVLHISKTDRGALFFLDRNSRLVPQ
jgi:hypothetical protein